MTATKVMGLEIHLGLFGVTDVKKVKHVKNMKTAAIKQLIVSSYRQ